MSNLEGAVTQLTNQFQYLFQHNKLSPAHLIECALSEPLRQIIVNITSSCLCQESVQCHRCSSCLVLKEGSHPDLLWLSPVDGPIKVEDIRKMEQSIYTAPKVAPVRIVVIEGADTLSRAASNALLKTLEEPPARVLFLLNCQNRANVIATIRSRCAYWTIPVTLSSDDDWRALTAYITPEDSKHKLLVEREVFVAQLEAIYDQKASPIQIAELWQQYDTKDLLWLLYLIHSFALKKQVILGTESQGYFSNMSLLIEQIGLFRAMIKLINQGISLNLTLLCESILMQCKGNS